MSSKFLLALALVLSLVPVTSYGGGPRWVTGPPYFTAAGQGLPVQWYTRTPLYFTDPGDLSPYVNHAAADAIVSAAASVWNVPTAMFEIAQGGTLAEHVSSANTYMGSTGMVFPADVQSTNSSAIQIAVVYDSDGSVTDLLLGQAASSPLECLSNGVTESVDSLTPDGLIHHAVIIVNGRCTGPAPEQQLQLQYQLERVFGRVIGLGWSQNNDNVFTRTPTPTLAQAQHWPIMHPIDVVCGQYTYQCLPQPFTLRDDDVASITQLYLRGYSNQFGWTGYNVNIPGKTASYDRAAHAFGSVVFASGQPMQGVNLVLRRQEMFWNQSEAFSDVSTVSGYLFQQNAGNPVTGAPSGIDSSMGTANDGYEGYFDFGWIPMIDDQQGWVNVLVTTEAINPLYIGAHAVGPYTTGTVSPAGAPTTTFTTGLYPNDAGFFATDISFAMDKSQTGCPPESDGTESAPAAMSANGFFNGAICGHGHTSWFSFSVRPGRTATAEVTALDESGAATQVKVRPLLGVWSATDASGTAPTLGATVAPFNTIANGTTGLAISGRSGALRLAVSDARGDGRPDYAYSLRVLAADAVQPTSVGLAGGVITITGMGFRSGNQVLINGVTATVTNWSANSITAIAPPVSAFSRRPAAPVNVTVNDLQTGGTSTIYNALTYSGVAASTMTVVSAPSGTVAAGAVAAIPFAVRVLQSDGVTPTAGTSVVFSATAGTVGFSGCPGTACTATTDATGVASIAVSPQSFGSITLQAAAAGTSVTATFSAVMRVVVPARATQYIAAGNTVTWSSRATLTENSLPASGVAVHWAGSPGVSTSSADSISSASGIGEATLTAVPLGAPTQGQVCGWATASPVCATFSVVPVAPADWRLLLTGGAGQSISAGAAFANVTMQVTDTSGNPVAGVPVNVYQAVNQAQMDCPVRGVCPVPAPLAISQTTSISDADGNVAFQPLQTSGTAAVTNIVITAGTQGFLSLSLTQNR